MGGDGVHVALAQGGVDQLPVLKAVEVPQGGQGGVGQKQFLRLGGALHSQGAALQVGNGFNIAAGHYGHHLAAGHVGAGPAVVILPSIDGKAAPHAVNVAGFQQLGLSLPVDDGKLGAVAHAPECLFGKLHIDAGGGAVLANIVKGWVDIAAHQNRGQAAFLTAAGGHIGAAHQPGGQAKGCQEADDTF